jgi:hypothetical protein
MARRKAKPLAKGRLGRRVLFNVQLADIATHRSMSALGGGFNRSTQHLLIFLEVEVCDGGDCTDMVHAAAEG